MMSFIRIPVVISFVVGSLFCQAQLDKINGGLPIVGAITEEGKRCADAVVTVYEGNTVVNTFTTPKNGRFQMLLHLNKFYTLEVSKPGYVAKRISINTNLGQRKAELPVYECDLDIIPETLFGDLDIGKLDFPMAIVTYNPKSKSFSHNETYTSAMRQTYENLLVEAFTPNETAMSK
jgi:hypothetical protein